MPLQNIRATLSFALAITLTGCGGGGGGFGNYGNYGGQSGNRYQSIACSSNDGGRQTCKVGFPIAGADIEQQLSNSPCTLGQTWGYNGKKVWVDQGCRARFRLYAQGYGSQPNGGGGGGWNGGNSEIIRCQSNNGGGQRCDTGFKISHAEVAGRLSNAPCKLNRDWGYDKKGVWVTRGCQADFRVYRR